MSKRKYEVGTVIEGIRIKEELPPQLYNHSRKGIKKDRRLLLEYPDGHEEVVLLQNIKKKILPSQPQKRGRPKKQPEKYNKLTLIHSVAAYKSPCGAIKKQALFECDCGKQAVKIVDYVKSGHTKSCGCDRTGRPKKDLVGLKMGTYSILEEFDINMVGKSVSNKSHSRLFLCECDRGGRHELTMARLRSLKNNQTCTICK